jgi:hypothetical protein
MKKREAYSEIAKKEAAFLKSKGYMVTHIAEIRPERRQRPLGREFEKLYGAEMDAAFELALEVDKVGDEFLRFAFELFNVDKASREMLLNAKDSPEKQEVIDKYLCLEMPEPCA